MQFRPASDISHRYVLCGYVLLPIVQLPHHLPHHAERKLRVVVREREAAQFAAQLLFRGGFSTGGDVAAVLQRFKNELRQPLHLGGLRGCGPGCLCGGQRRSAESAHQLIHANRHGLAEVHGDMLLARGDAQQAMAVGEIVVGQAGLL